MQLELSNWVLVSFLAICLGSRYRMLPFCGGCSKTPSLSLSWRSETHMSSAERRTGPLRISDWNHSMHYLITEIEGPQGFLTWVKRYQKFSRNVKGIHSLHLLLNSLVGLWMVIGGGARGGVGVAGLCGPHLKIHSQTRNLRAALKRRGFHVERHIWSTPLIFNAAIVGAC